MVTKRAMPCRGRDEAEDSRGGPLDARSASCRSHGYSARERVHFRRSGDAGRRDGWRRGTRRLLVAFRRGDAVHGGLPACEMACGLISLGRKFSQFRRMYKLVRGALLASFR